MAAAPQNSRAHGTSGRGVQNLIRLAAAAALRAYPTWRAQLWRGEKRKGAGAAGFQLPLARSPVPRLCALRQPAGPAAFNRGPPRPRPGPPPAPPPFLPTPDLRSQPSLRLPPDSSVLLALCLRLWFFTGTPRPGAVRRVVLNPRALPLCAGAGASRCHPHLGQTMSWRAAGTGTGTGHGAGKVTEPWEVGTVFGAGPRVMGCHWGIRKGACGRWVKHLDIHSLHSWTSA